MKTIALIGFAERTLKYFHELGETTEIWTMNYAWDKDIPRIDRLFEIHLPKYLRTQTGELGRKHYAWLQQKHPFPIFTLPKAHAEMPSAVRYPYEDVVSSLLPGFLRGDRVNEVFTQTPDYMLALAIYEHVNGLSEPLERIEVIGIEMSTETEYAYQRPGFLFWCGQAVAHGIQVVLHPESQLFKPKVYHKGGQMIGRQALEEHLRAHDKTRQECLGIYNDLHGRFKAVQARHAQGQASDKELQAAGVAMSKAHAEVYRASGAYQAIKLLIEAIDVEDVDIQLVDDLQSSKFESVEVSHE